MNLLPRMVWFFWWRYVWPPPPDYRVYGAVIYVGRPKVRICEKRPLRGLAVVWSKTYVEQSPGSWRTAPRQGGKGQGMTAYRWIAIGLVLALAVGSVVAWFTHVIVCIKTASYLFLIAGALLVPIGVIHGVGIWIGAW